MTGQPSCSDVQLPLETHGIVTRTLIRGRRSSVIESHLLRDAPGAVRPYWCLCKGVARPYLLCFARKKRVGGSVRVRPRREIEREIKYRNDFFFSFSRARDVSNIENNAFL